MTNGLIDTIAADLGLDYIKNSVPNTVYQSIVVYTAASYWVKASINDLSFDFPQGSHKHTVYVTNQFISKMMELYQISLWFKTGEDESSGQKIINILLKTGEINEVGLDSNNLSLSLPKEEFISISDSFAICKGALTNINSVQAGVSTISSNNHAKKLNFIDNALWVTDFLNNICLNATLHEIISNRRYYFEPTRPYSSKWEGREVSGKQFSLFKIISNNRTLYYIGVSGKNYRLSDDTIDRGDGYRFIIKLYEEYKKNTVMFTHVGKELFQIYLSCPLPRYEYSMILSVMWPCRSIDDKFEFIGPNIVLPFVEEIMNHIGMVIKWQN